MKFHLIILFLLFFLNSCFNDYDCLFEFPDEGNRITIMELKSNSTFDEFEILRISSFEGDSYFPYDFALNFDSYTDNLDYSLFDEGIVNYGLNLDVYQDSLSFKDLKLDNRFLDYLPDNEEVLTRKSDFKYYYFPSSNDSLYLSSNFIIKRNLKALTIDTLFRDTPILIDSTIYRTKYFFDAFFDNEGSTVFLVTQVHNTIAEHSSGTKYLHSENIENYILKVNTTSGIIDTLYKEKAVDEFDRPSFFANKYGVFLKLDNGDVISIDKNANMSRLNTRYLPFQFNFNGSISVGESELYAYNHLTNKEIYFAENFGQLKYAFPGKSTIAAVEILNRDSLYIYDIKSQDNIKTIDFEKTPAFPPIKNEDFSVYEFKNPLLTQDDELIVMAVQKTWLLDPDFRCYD